MAKPLLSFVESHLPPKFAQESANSSSEAGFPQPQLKIQEAKYLSAPGSDANGPCFARSVFRHSRPARARVALRAQLVSPWHAPRAPLHSALLLNHQPGSLRTCNAFPGLSPGT